MSEDSFLSRGRVVALAAAALVTVVVGVLIALGFRSTCSADNVEVACPSDPIGPDGLAVSDQFYFAHQPMGENGTITVRMTSMTGIITYPPPDHDEIVAGLVPWAKVGIMIKDGVTPGSSYAALMLTGAHGVRMQHDYLHDIAGSAPVSPVWLRLTRSGSSITGHESVDGREWTEVGTVAMPGLPEMVEVGLFATSPGDLTLRPVALGASIGESRFTQASATFDNISLDGSWSHGPVGEMGHTDWERLHRPAGFSLSGDTTTVTGSGDIGPGTGGHGLENTLRGVAIGLVILIVVTARFRCSGLPPVSGSPGRGQRVRHRTGRRSGRPTRGGGHGGNRHCCA